MYAVELSDHGVDGEGDRVIQVQSDRGLDFAPDEAGRPREGRRHAAHAEPWRTAQEGPGEEQIGAARRIRPRHRRLHCRGKGAHSFPKLQKNWGSYICY